MKCLFLAIAAVVALAQADDATFKKQVDATFIEKQKKVLDILTGIPVHHLDSEYNHEHKHFPFNKPELYSNPKAVEDFMHGYERGFLPRDGVFTLHDYRARHDTFNLFEIMFFAKDFDTFIEIAKWAKNELNLMQFGYAFCVAMTHRPDCRGLYFPPTYELYPHYFVPSEVMRQADVASFHGVDYRVFEVNNTGYEHSWYEDIISGVSKSHNRWAGDAMESRLAYFREDPGLNHWYVMNSVKKATWLSPKKHPGIDFVKRGKAMYSIHKWLLSRYNLERMSSALPFVEPFDWDKEVVGYNPRLTDHLGRPFISRPDHIVPYKMNPTAFKYLEYIENRIHETIDHGYYWDVKNSSYVKWDSDDVDILGKIIFGDRDANSRSFYKPWFFLMLEAINDMIHSSNEREYTTSTFGKFMTVARDPLFYQVLAAMDDWFETYFSHLPAYKPEELNFPGVKFQDIHFSKLTTYFERFEYEITNGVMFHKPEDLHNKKYVASQFRINHKPFHFNFTVESDRPHDAMVRIFFGPKKNIDYHDMSLNQARHAFFLSYYFPIKLKAGVNFFEKSSDDFYFYEHYEPMKTFKERLAKAESAGKPFTINTMNNCGLPDNLMLPKGWKMGREYTVFAMIEPIRIEKKTYDAHSYYHCDPDNYLDKPALTYPFDRTIAFPKKFVQPNMMFHDVMIYHKSEHDLNRPSTI